MPSARGVTSSGWRSNHAPEFKRPVDAAVTWHHFVVAVGNFKRSTGRNYPVHLPLPDLKFQPSDHFTIPGYGLDVEVAGAKTLGTPHEGHSWLRCLDGHDPSVRRLAGLARDHRRRDTVALGTHDHCVEFKGP
jgi:hypothetical protein